jgi:hypothetical protein
MRPPKLVNVNHAAGWRRRECAIIFGLEARVLVTLHGTLTVDDLRRVLYYGMFRRPQTIGTVVMFSLALVSLAAMVWLVPASRAISIAVYASPFVFLQLSWCLSLVVLPFRAAKKRFADEKVWSEPGDYAFEPEEIRINRPSGPTAMKWNAITDVRETKSLFLLQIGNNSSIPVPKRFFTSAAEIDAWKQLVLSRVTRQRGISPRGVAARWC